MDLESKRRQVAALRSKTVANGASEGEALNAARLADRLEQRYGLRPEPAAAGRGGRPERTARTTRGNRTIVSADQYRALLRGQTVQKVQLGVPHAFRIDGDTLVQSTERTGETRHPIRSAERACGNVIIRCA